MAEAVGATEGDDVDGDCEGLDEGLAVDGDCEGLDEGLSVDGDCEGLDEGLDVDRDRAGADVFAHSSDVPPIMAPTTTRNPATSMNIIAFDPRAQENPVGLSLA